MFDTNPDLILVGGGLANCLIALRLMDSRPEIDFLLLEQGARIGGRHTWSFFQSDVGPEILSWLSPLIVQRWQTYEVRFPTRRRTLASPYASITSDRLAEIVTARLGDRCLTGVTASVLEARRVVLSDGRVLEAGAVIDGRGPGPLPDLDLGYQKFVGQMVRLKSPHGLAGPIIMDATMPQTDGYRFLYTLPFDDLRLLIEDTRYADGAAVDHADFLNGIREYAAGQGWVIDAVEAEEEGVLPVALDGNIEKFWSRDPDLPRVGLRGAMFHPTTGYSLPDAARLAGAIAALPALTAPALMDLIRGRSLELWRNRAYFRILNRILFRAGDPSGRYKIMQRFYGLSAAMIARFYAADLRLADQIRILVGRPPVSMLSAFLAGFGLRGGR